MLVWTPRSIGEGEPRPLGASLQAGGVNFSLFSRSATWVELLLFERYDDPAPVQVVPLDPSHHRTLDYWHVWVAGLGEGQVYGFRVHGPNEAEAGHRFDGDKVLLDPYARGIVYGENWSHLEACREGPNVRSAMKSLVVDPSHYDWGGVRHPAIGATERVIYELHVRGFTRHPSAGAKHPGTFDALVEKIDYLKDLGVTSVELLPVFQFDEDEVALVHPKTGRPLKNFWGYSPIGFFAPHRGYYTEGWRNMTYLTGFRDMVRAFHRAGLEVLLDVVFNHTAEGHEGGPTLSFRGLENSLYYLLDPNDRRRYLNYSGCGNTLSCNQPQVRRLVLDALRYWTEVMHVDGFRFDLASILSRDELGRPMPNPPLIFEIESDPALESVRLIAEAWDAAGLYQVGWFPGQRWQEWNGQFRDDVRCFLRGDHGFAGRVAARMTGSADLYAHHRRVPAQSVNYVTCHDGFTLNDLVSYAHKHNEDNGEDNRDGADENHSANHGVEGPTSDPAIERLRLRQSKNFLAVLFLSHGTPMLLAGDELRRTQRGNNNAYCQDNEVSWVDWSLLPPNRGLHRFVRELLRFRARHPALRPPRYLLGHDHPAPTNGLPRLRWHGVRLDRPDWSHHSRTVAYTLTRSAHDVAIHVIVNAFDAALDFAVPPPSPGSGFVVAIDTARDAPYDLPDPGTEVVVREPAIRVDGRSVVVLVERRGAG